MTNICKERISEKIGCMHKVAFYAYFMSCLPLGWVPKIETLLMAKCLGSIEVCQGLKKSSIYFLTAVEQLAPAESFEFGLAAELKLFLGLS